MGIVTVFLTDGSTGGPTYSLEISLNFELLLMLEISFVWFYTIMLFPKHDFGASRGRIKLNLYRTFFKYMRLRFLL